MRLARVLGAIGRALISAGVIVLLFVAYQLWGTGLQHQQAQKDLEGDFLQLLDSDLAAEAQQVDASGGDAAESDELGDPALVENAGQDPQAAVLPDPQEIEYSTALIDALYPDDGEIFARISIPAIDVDEIAVEGVSVEALRKGPGHYPTTPHPGQAGNASIAGHRTTYGAPFHRVDELNPGDKIIVETLQGVFTYIVRENTAPDGSTKGYFIVSPSDTWVLGQESGENLLTLTACHPKYSARQRIIVQAELVGDPEPTIPRGEDADLEPLEITSGGEGADDGPDEFADGPASDAGEPGADVGQVMSDEVALDDDPSAQIDSTDNETQDSATQDNDEAAGDPAVDQIDGAASTSTDAGADPSSDTIENVSGETPFDTEEDFGEGLNGDPSKIRPAMMWGIAGGAIWLAAWFIGRRLNRRVTLYLLAMVPFVPALWSCFVNIDQALPSY